MMSTRDRWTAAVLGLSAVVVGVFLVFKPFASVPVLAIGVGLGCGVLGVHEALRIRGTRTPLLTAAAAALWLIVGVALLAWPGVTVWVIAVAAGVGLIVTGVLDLIGAVRRAGDNRLPDALLGAAAIVAGSVALSWPDVTIFVVAVVVGIRLLWFGFGRLTDAVRGRAQGDDQVPTRADRVRRTILAAVAFVAALALGAAGVIAQVNTPRPDAFYDAPDEIPAEPGHLLRAESFDRQVPDNARAWRILYTSTRDDGRPALASALVVAPKTPGAQPHPVIAWAHGTTGVARGCAPSILDDPFTAGATPALRQVVDAGWVLVATDYIGLGTASPHPYLIGQGEGRSVLDSVRAARMLTELRLSDKTVVWGHSQGGHAALWTGILAPTYAPDVPLAGVAALAPAANLTGLVASLEQMTGGAIFAAYVLEAYRQEYPDIGFDLARVAARLPLREMAARCLAEPEVFVSIVSSLIVGNRFFAGDPTQGAMGRRLVQNIPSAPLSMPVFIGQGADDSLVTPTAQRDFVSRQCAAGSVIDYRTYPGRGHIDLVAATDSALIGDLLGWTADRFAGRPAASTC
ncbi:lipase family protein [Gordonia sp. ABSL1-1]|uniref:lipase family protein n=1 Tax=Gordonia sp. ABSL1-1 TaxID=3053923 RepID=UPI0025729E9D|nr:lipase family protein [Gordonia sp. ABSL1-1]MDL9936814.1 lipase family protein [Gordonia sp. ABSL1-1]